MRLLFFATPILWMPPPGSFLDRVAQLNPISHFIAIVRDPLIHDTVPMLSWVVVLVITAIGVPAGVLCYARTRDKIVFWV
jgi:ABC-type polysaccharide/polyol phosphate export permease